MKTFITVGKLKEITAEMPDDLSVKVQTTSKISYSTLDVHRDENHPFCDCLLIDISK